MRITVNRVITFWAALLTFLTMPAFAQTPEDLIKHEVGHYILKPAELGGVVTYDFRVRCADNGDGQFKRPPTETTCTLDDVVAFTIPGQLVEGRWLLGVAAADMGEAIYDVWAVVTMPNGEKTYYPHATMGKNAGRPGPAMIRVGDGPEKFVRLLRVAVPSRTQLAGALAEYQTVVHKITFENPSRSGIRARLLIGLHAGCEDETTQVGEVADLSKIPFLLRTVASAGHYLCMEITGPAGAVVGAANYTISRRPRPLGTFQE